MFSCGRAARKAVLVGACISMIAGVLLVAGCQPKAASDSDSADNPTSGQTAQAVEFVWSEESDCSLCHQVQHDAMTDGHASFSCVDCHADTSTLEYIHEGKSADDKVSNRLKKTEVTEATCEACHGSYADLAVKTIDCVALTDSEGTIVNPHEAKELGPEEHGDMTCASCHAEHDGDAVDEAAQKFCISCHHDGVYECYTCHQ